MEVIDKPYWDAYAPDALNGIGYINSTSVRCVSIEHLLKTLDESKRELREKDKEDLAFVLSEKIEWVGLSFVRSANDVKILKKIIDKQNLHRRFPEGVTISCHLGMNVRVVLCLQP